MPRRTVAKHGPHPVDVHVGGRVRMRRTLLGMTQTVLGDALELAFHQVQKNEYQWDKQLGAPIPGFSRHDCNAVMTDSLDHVVTWRGNADLSGIGDTEVMLKFVMRNAELYGFKID